MSAHRFNVLICEDDPGVRRLMTVLLDRQGIFSSSADDGEAALNEIIVHEPDLILLDLMMTRLSGFEVIAWLKQNRPALLPRVVVVTAANNATTRAIENEPIRKVLRKPFDIDDLRSVVLEFAAASVAESRRT